MEATTTTATGSGRWALWVRPPGCLLWSVFAWVAVRDRLLPRWIGWVSVPFVLAPWVFMGATGLPGFPGVVDSAWLVIVSLGLALGGRRQAA